MNKRKINTEEAFKLMNLPELHSGSKLDSIPEKCFHKKHIVSIVDSIREFVNNGDNLLLWGDFGTGKSACASILLKASLSKGFLGLWTSYEDYINAVMSGYYYNDEKTFEERCKEVPILVIDELIIRENSKQKEVLIEILTRNRLEKKRSTIITTNHSPEWMKLNHKSFFSLFTGHYSILEVKGYNFRG